MEKIQQTPLVSVVIPLYNKERVLLKTLESVRKQIFTNYEVVIVNDGSTDRSLEIIQNYLNNSDQSKIRLISQVNGGVSAARNRGIEESRGKYIAFLDADDEWLPDFLSSIYFLLKKYPECDVFGTQYFYKEPERMYEAGIKGFSFTSQDGLVENYSTGAKSANSLLSPENDLGGKILFQLVKKYPMVRGLKRYCFLWHKMRFVMLVGDGRKKEAFVEYIKTWPYGLLNLDCYYRLFLNLLPCKFHASIKQVIGKP